MEYSNVFDYLRLQGCERIFVYIFLSRELGGPGGGGGVREKKIIINNKLIGIEIQKNVI